MFINSINSILTPTSKTGVSPTENTQPRLVVLVDYLAGSYPPCSCSQVQSCVAKAFGGGSFEPRQAGLSWYEKSYIHPSGALIGTGHRGGNGRNYLELKGAVLDALEDSQLHELMKSLLELGFTASRIDLTLDDFAKTFSARDAKEAYDAYGVKGFRERTKPAGVWHELGVRGASGGSMAFGKRGSKGGGKYVVIYDKFLESNGERDCVRIELSLYNVSSAKFAHQAFENLVACPELWFDIIRGHVAWAIDFVDRGGDRGKDFNRCERYLWWKRIMEASPVIGFQRNYKPPTIDRSKSWVQKQVAPTMATIINSFSNDESWWEWFWGMVFSGEERMTERHHFMLLSATG